MIRPVVPVETSLPYPELSVVLPVHNERENLGRLISEIDQSLERYRYEIVAVDDGSTDGSRNELERLAHETPALRVIGLSRQVGQSAALAAGFDEARSPIVVTMDADGQYDPADIPRLVELLRSDSSLAAVAGIRTTRADSWWKRLQSVVANRVRDALTGDRVQDTGCALRAVRSDVLARVPRFSGMHRFLPTLIRLVGGTVTQIPVAHRARWHGQSHYGMFGRAMRGLVDALGVRWLSRRTLRYQRDQGDRITQPDSHSLDRSA